MVKETLADKRKQLDEFTHTFMRLYSQKDFKRIIRTNNLGRLFISLGKGPIALLFAFFAPVDHLIPLYSTFPFIYQLPVIAALTFGVGKAFESSGTWYQYHVKKQLYMKYKDQMELDKEHVMRLEAEEKNRLQIEHKNIKK